MAGLVKRANSSVRGDYDANEDVLYLFLECPEAAGVREDDDGLLVRYSRASGKACGVTVLSFIEAGWNTRAGYLEQRIGEHLGVSDKDIETVIRQVTPRD